MTGSPKVSTWMPFYVGDYLADTTHLSTAEHGAYLLLILTYWRNEEPLEDDNARLARIVGATPREWSKLRPAVAPFFTIEGGRWQHKRIDAELAAAKERRTTAKARSDAANAAKAARQASGPPNRPPSRSPETDTSKVTLEAPSSPSPSPSREEIDRAPSLPVGPAQAPASHPRPAGELGLFSATQGTPGVPALATDSPAGTAARSKIARRLPDDWPLTNELLEVAQRVRLEAGLPPIDVQTEHAKFSDYWHAKSGKDATKTDWLATWRNWIRNARAPGGRGSPEAFGAGMRGQIADAMSMIDRDTEEGPTWPALPAN